MKYLKVNNSTGATEGIIELELSDTYLNTVPANLSPYVTNLNDYLTRPIYTVMIDNHAVQVVNAILYDWTLEFWVKCKFAPNTSIEKPIFDYLVFATHYEDTTLVTDTTLTSIIRLYFSPEDGHNYVLDVHGQKKIIYRSVLDNRWNHIAIVQAGATSVIAYVNGNPLVGKNTDQINLTYKFDRIKFNVYEDDSITYIANINVSDAPRYNKYFNPFTSLPSSTYGLGITEEGITTLRDLDTNHSDTAETNQIYFPFQTFDLEDKGKMQFTWTPNLYISGSLAANEDALNQLVDASELSYFNINDVDYNLRYGRKFTITTKNNGLYCLKSVQDIELNNAFEEFTIDCFFKISYSQGSIIDEISIIREQITTTNSGIHTTNSLYAAGQTFVGASLYALKAISATKFSYNKIYHYALVYKNYIMRHYINGKLFFIENSKSLSASKVNLMLGTVGVYYTSNNQIHTSNMYLSHFRLNSTALWQTDFDPAQELFIENGVDIPEKISTNNKTAPEENTALLYPAVNPNSLYDRVYNDENYTFKPEFDSTLAIKQDTAKLLLDTAPSKWASYVAITSNTYSDRYNYIKFIANKPILENYTVEFWVYVEMKETDSSYRNLAYFSGRESFFGVQINGYGLLNLIYSKINRYSTNYEIRRNSDSHEQLFTTSYIDQWIHIAFTHSQITSNGVTGTYALNFYANGRLLETFTDWSDNSLLRLFLTTGDMDANIVPYYTGLKVSSTVKYTGEQFDIANV